MKPKYDTELLTIFKSTPQDLETNRSGLISKRQIKRLKKDFSVAMKRAIAICCIFMPLIFFAVDRIYNSSLRYEGFQFIADAIIILLIILGLFVPTALITIYMTVNIIFAQNRVKLIDGKIEFGQIRSWGTSAEIDFIRVSKKRFVTIEEDAVSRLKRYDPLDTVYRLYYIPYRNIILSAEKIE